MSITRRSLIAATTLLPLVHIPRARAGEFNLKLSNTSPAAHPQNLRLMEMVGRIAEQTDGEVQIKVYPGSQISTDGLLVSKLRSGEVDFGTITGFSLAPAVPLASIDSIGFAFSNYNQVWGVMDGELGGRIRRDINAANLVSMGRILDNGFRQTTAKQKPIHTPDDFHSLKLRVPPGELSQSMFSMLGAAVTTLDFSLLYAALRDGVVEGQENPLAIIQTGKLYEVQSYCSLTNHQWSGFWPIGSAQTWSRLPSRARDIIEAEFERAVLLERNDLVRFSPAARGDLLTAGIEINAVNIGDFQQALSKAGFYTKWRGNYGDSWQLLEQAVGSLA